MVDDRKLLAVAEGIRELNFREVMEISNWMRMVAQSRIDNGLVEFDSSSEMEWAELLTDWAEHQIDKDLTQ